MFASSLPNRFTPASAGGDKTPVHMLLILEVVVNTSDVGIDVSSEETDTQWTRLHQLVAWFRL